MTHSILAAPISICLAITPLIQTQTAHAAYAQFEVASVKTNTSGEARFSINRPDGSRFTATNSPLNLLIGMAYKVRPNQISGAPAWAASVRYDIAAKTEGNPTPEQAEAMIRALLEDRFMLI